VGKTNVVVKAVRQQKTLIELYPDSPASKCFFNLAEKTCKNQPDTSSRGNIHFFGDQINLINFYR